MDGSFTRRDSYGAKKSRTGGLLINFDICPILHP
jgi:hypothetical protein